MVIKIKKQDVSPERIWEAAEVSQIPVGWRREVYYSPAEEELYSILLTGGTYYVPPEGDVFLETFISLEEWYARSPLSSEELTGDPEREPSRGEIEECYQTLWWEEYVFPPEW